MQKLKGTVISVKTPQTVIVTVEYVMHHPKYKKIMKRTTKLVAHAEKEVKVGDKVQLVKTRPFSKTKHFRLL